MQYLKKLVSNLLFVTLLININYNFCLQAQEKYLSHKSYLSLPNSLKAKSVYYIKTNQLKNWSCGYNALFNACNIEHELGLGNRYKSFGFFGPVCSKYLNIKKLKSTQASTNIVLEDLSKILKLQKFQFLGFNSQKQVHPVVSGKVAVKYCGCLTKPQLNDLFKKAMIAKEQNIISSLKNHLNTRNQVCCMHFVCHVISHNIPHGILVTLVQNKNGRRSLYICDNLNALINENSQIKKYIDYLCHTFSVSRK